MSVEIRAELLADRDRSLALGPIGVVPRRQREGIGSALMRSALDEARARREPAVILLGDPAFYPRFGFEPASALDWRNPFTGAQPNGFVVREEDLMVAVVDDRARDFTGRVRWHPAFGQVS